MFYVTLVLLLISCHNIECWYGKWS